MNRAICALMLAGSVFGSHAHASQQDAGTVERGRSVAIAADCGACHTRPGGEPFAGGYAIASPMGKIIATNITPSLSAGIGKYSLEDFGRAVREGVLPDGKHLYPAMPYPSYRGMTDEDLSALYHYLMKEVKPVDTPALEVTALSFPFNIRSTMTGWNLMFSRGGWSAPKDLNAEQTRGAYLVDVLAHCGACHTSRGLLMNEDASAYLAGGNIGGWVAPNLTSDPIQGIGAWTDEELISYLRDGLAVGKGSAAGPMGEAVEHSFSKMSASDLKAMVAYLRTVPTNRNAPSLMEIAAHDWKTAKPGKLNDYETGFDYTPNNLRAYEEVTSGAQLYSGACSTCHGEDGQGVSGTYPSLTSNATVGASDPSNLIMVISEGINRHDARGYTVMPGFHKDLNDKQIAALVNYITQRFGNPTVNVSAETVRSTLNGGPSPWLVNNIWLLMGTCALAVAVAAMFIVRRWRTHSLPTQLRSFQTP